MPEQYRIGECVEGRAFCQDRQTSLPWSRHLSSPTLPDTMATENREHLARLRELYPGLTDREVDEIDDVYDRYIALVSRIYERVQQDPEAYARFKTLTASRNVPTMERQHHS
jgi:hypothetical protein